MINYENLKKCSRGIPTWESLIPATLNIIVEKQRLKRDEFQKLVADSIGMPLELRNHKYENKDSKWDKSIVEHRVAWAITKLKLAGLIDYPERGIQQITPLGRELYEKYGENLDDKILKNQPKYIDHKRNDREQNNGNEDQTIEFEMVASNENTPQELMGTAFSKINSALMDELLEEIMAQPPAFFEKLVVKLLIKMGYGGALDGEGIVTQTSNDEGIDGIIREDKLGFSNIYIQAKRHALDSTIGRPDVQAFVGAIARKEGKGLFITTAKFAKPARDYAKENHVVLVDGDDLADLMIEYNLGVSTIHSYEIKKIDSDFFDD